MWKESNVSFMVWGTRLMAHVHEHSKHDLTTLQHVHNVLSVLLEKQFYLVLWWEVVLVPRLQSSTVHVGETGNESSRQCVLLILPCLMLLSCRSVMNTNLAVQLVLYGHSFPM